MPQRKRAASLAGLAQEIGKQEPGKAVLRIGSGGYEPVEAISTGSIRLDALTGIGGIPRGRITELFGKEGGGKTTLALHVCASAQAAGFAAAFIDAEHTFDPALAAGSGVRVDEDSFLLIQPANGGVALRAGEMILQSGKAAVMVIDSAAALMPESFEKTRIGDAHVADRARLIADALMKFVPLAADSKTAVIFVNQLREKIGVMFGNPETTPGGRSLKFYASMRLSVRPIGGIKRGDSGPVIGNRVLVRCEKNKHAPPMQSAEIDLIFGRGFDFAAELRDVATERGILQSKGGRWYLDGVLLGHGKEAAAEGVMAREQEIRALLLKGNN